jgi:hypothetical protein
VADAGADGVSRVAAVEVGVRLLAVEPFLVPLPLRPDPVDVAVQWPGLGAYQLREGDLDVTRDYRSVLAEILRSRFPETDVSQVFPDFRPETIGTMRAA